MQCLDYLYSIPRGRRSGNQESLIKILEKLNNPQNTFEYIHVAGTNGKGSVCAYLENCLIDCNQRVGLFTSPHLIKINERIRLNGVDITDDDFERIFYKVEKLIKEYLPEGFDQPTFFEFIYIIAMVYFSEKNVRFVIVEAGVGGLKDTTNIIERPLLSIITAISLDHTEILGNSLKLIAKEKAGIIKQGCPVIYYNNHEVIQTVIDKKIRELKCIGYDLKDSDIENINICGKKIDFSFNSRYHNRYNVSLKTNALYQVVNSSLAILAMEIILAAIKDLRQKDDILKRRLLQSIQNTRWSGRMEELRERLYIDGAHNKAAVTAFTHSIESSFKEVDLYLIFAVGNEKDYRSMIGELCRLANLKGVVITETGVSGSADLKELREIFEKNWNGLIYSTYNIREALLKGRQWTRDRGILCCIGSLYLAGSIKQILGGTVNDQF